MHPLVRALFPPLASFGPLLMVIGLGGSASPLAGGPRFWFHVLALAGALATGFALLVLYKQQVRITERLGGPRLGTPAGGER